MKVNILREVTGAVAQVDIVEGRCVLLTANVWSHNFGSREDLPGVKLPTSSGEADKAFYIVAWTPDNTEPPIYEPYPALSFSLRYGGFDQSANVPFDAKVRMTAPSVQIGQTIPSGYLCLAHSRGVYEIPSGHFVYSASAIMVGEYLVPEYASGSDRGKLKHSASATKFQVVGYDSSTGHLTVKSLL
jgi:hypothetical protein